MNAHSPTASPTNRNTHIGFRIGSIAPNRMASIAGTYFNALVNKIYFGLGATISSFLFFFTIGYLAKYSSKYLNNKKTWFYINILVILFMTVLSFYVLNTILNFY